MLFLRINAALVFLSLCLGNVLVQFVANDATSWVTNFSDSISFVPLPENKLVSIILLLLPPLLTAIFLIRTVHGNAKLALNVLPATGVGLLGALLVVPLLTPGLSHNIVASSLWDQAHSAQEIIVGGSAIVCLLVLWLQRPSTGGKHGKKHKG